MNPKYLEKTVTKSGDKILLIDTEDQLLEFVMWLKEDESGLMRFIGDLEHIAIGNTMNEVVKLMAKISGQRMPPSTKVLVRDEL